MLRQLFGLKMVGGVIIALGFLLTASISVPLVKLTPICVLQGRDFTTPYQNQFVRTQGVVVADLDDTSKRGFFMQANPCDDDPTTSDGIFVYLGVKTNLVNQGDLVEVAGFAQEYDGLTEISVSPENLTILATNQSLPTVSELYPPRDDQQARAYFESLEGMLVGLGEGAVVGATDKNDQTWLVRTDLGITRVFQDDSAGTGIVICSGDSGRFKITPEVKVGDQVTGLQGALDMAGDVACIQLTKAPQVVSKAVTSQRASSAAGASFRLATFNLAELFDTVDDPTTNDTVLSPAEYQRRLQKRAMAIHDPLGEPEILAVQEVENDRVLKDLLARPEIKADYQILWRNGPDRRGIDVALLYRTDRVNLLDYQVYQGCTSIIDGLGPDGNEDVINPQNSITCDTDSDGVLDGNRLFSRPPLLAHLQVCLEDCSAPDPHRNLEFTLLINHWKSKVEDTTSTAYTLPRRLEEANFVAGLIRELKSTAIGQMLVVSGDLNDEATSQPLQKLTGTGLWNLLPGIDKQQRYSYIYQGRSQMMDYVLVQLTPELFPGVVAPIHFNADYPAVFETVNNSVYRSSDHDPVLVQFQLLDHFIYLPAVFQPDH